MSTHIDICISYIHTHNRINSLSLSGRYFRVEASAAGAEEEEEPVAGPAARSMSGSRAGVAGAPRRLRSPPPGHQELPATAQENKEPSLTIIDFNQLTRGGLDLATGRSKPNNTIAPGKRRPSPKRKLLRAAMINSSTRKS